MTDATEHMNQYDMADIETQRVLEEVKKEKPLDYTGSKANLAHMQINTEQEEEYAFEAQVDSVLSILINSVYSSKDYFLRELISNACDAINKRKTLDLEMGGGHIEEELCIKVVPNKENNTISIIDTGIGMSKADLINFLGSIAASGTKELKKKLAENEGKSMNDLIGQFGLGFYSAFLVSDQVDVISKSSEDVAHIWSSRGPGGFVIAPFLGEAAQGTTVVLHIAEKCRHYLDEKKIEDIIKVHSGFIPYNIYLYVLTEKKRKIEGKDSEEAAKEPKLDEETDAVEDKAEEEKEEEMETYIEGEYKHMNKEKPLWSRNPKEEKIEESEYEAFYKTLTNDWEKHFAVNHSFIEGEFEMQLLLFVQNRAPFNMFEASKKPNNIKLYVQNVLITSDLTEAVPEWMSFIHGVISSKDIPVNVSREVIQGKSVMTLIKRVLTKKVLDMLKDIAKDKEQYLKLYKNCGSCLKVGIYKEKSDVSQKLAKLLRFQTTKSEEPISFDEYVQRMVEGQKQIYVITGVNIEEIKKHPMLERMKNYEVIYMPESIDEFVLQMLTKYEDLPLQRITSEGLELPQTLRDIKEEEETYKDLLAKIKEVLGEAVEKVVLSGELEDYACSIKSGKWAYSAAMEHIMRTQPGADSNPMYASGFMTKKVFEVNPFHPIIQGIQKQLNESDANLEKNIRLIYETSLLSCGYPISNLSNFATQVFDYIKTGMQ
ncbi:molecular chaperone HtpG [Nematocida sp. LUAm3]|nr:molecular chaperone HtpG [Nematocida sp. LUAm3]KAI5174022.1 molecular chaperone HtpG [Nematocida sp. LUAm2]KAI5177235.1 molecular chaperone HtpG [Nematocida sp. LUAm1]